MSNKILWFISERLGKKQYNKPIIWLLFMKAKERDLISLLIINIRTHILLHTITVSKYALESIYND